MAWQFDPQKPIYTQLVDRLTLGIVRGEYAPGERLPSVRELALEAAVNPNTVQRAYAELEAAGLAVTQRSSGRSVTENADAVGSLRSRRAQEVTETYFVSMRALGYTNDEIKGFVANKEDSL